MPPQFVPPIAPGEKMLEIGRRARRPIDPRSEGPSLISASALCHQILAGLRMFLVGVGGGDHILPD